MSRETQQSEDSILQLGQMLTERIYERYASGEITAEEMQETYRTLALWTELSEQLLNSVN